MKSFFFVVLGFAIGAAVALVLGFGAAAGAGAGAGIVTGLKAGACLTAEAAKEQGFIEADQVDDLLDAAIRQLASTEYEEEATAFGGEGECANLVSELKNEADD